MDWLNRTSLAIILFFIVIFGFGCLTGSTLFNYENKESGKIIGYERDGHNASTSYEDDKKAWEYEHRPAGRNFEEPGHNGL